MNDQLENQLSMFQKVQGHAVIHSAALATVPAIPLLHTEFNGYVTTILTTAGAATADLTGFAVDKQNKRADFTNALLNVSTAYAAWAYNTGIARAGKRFDDNPAALNAMRDSEIYTYAQDLLQIATPLLASITPYLSTPLDLTILTAKAAEYLALINQPKTQIDDRAAKLIALKSVFDKAMDLLRIRLDNVMRVFIVRNPLVYNSYQFTRGIDDTGSPTPPDYEGSINANTILEIANLPYLSARRFTLKNTGTVALVMALSNVNNGVQGTPAIVPPGEQSSVLSNTLNAAGGNFLLLQNTDAATAGSYEIRIVE